MDVTKKNFIEVFPMIKSSIKEADFIAIDGEFTGLTLSQLLEPSLFDTPQVRYSKMRKSLTQFTLCQFGLSAFIPTGKSVNSFKVHTFNFYLFPQSFGPVDMRFSCQASAIEFLRNHNFNFEKMFNMGVSYMNNQQISRLESLHKKDDISNHVDSIFLRQLDEKYIQPNMKEIEQFLKSDDQSLILDCIPSGIGQYLFLKTVQQNFKDIVCIKNNRKMILSKCKDDKADHDSSFEKLYQELFWDAYSFKNVIDIMIANKKPIIGHNIFADIVFLYDKIISNLPEKLDSFKADIHKMFPAVIDTKVLAFNLRRIFNDVNFFDSTNLEELFRVFTSSPAMFCKLHSPHVTHGENFNKYEKLDAPHEAGYDAYMTGYVFLQMAHLVSQKDVSSFDCEPVLFEKLYSAVAEYENHIHIARASVKYLILNGKDPPEETAQKFVVTPKRGNYLSPSKVAKDFIHFGSVDAIRLDSNRVLIGIFRRKNPDIVLKNFKDNENYTVEKYVWYYNSDNARKYIRYGKYAGITVVLVGSIYIGFRIALNNMVEYTLTRFLKKAYIL